GIFTPNATSLSPSSRQWGSRYAIRAGRNLPDKEFRYLRTVCRCYWMALFRYPAQSFLLRSACRHADRTVSSALLRAVWRAVSEDSRTERVSFRPYIASSRHRSCRFVFEELLRLRSD